VAAPIRISIITPSYNRKEFIDDAIKSVLVQHPTACEHLIIDGGSTDGTLPQLKKYPHLKVISEPDQGLYDALNKGIKIARGEIIGFLNSDDLYEPEIFEPILNIFTNHLPFDAVVGSARIFRKQNGLKQTVGIIPPLPSNQLAHRLTLGTPAINAWFFRKKALKDLGGFDLQYRIAADRELLIRFYLQGLQYGLYTELVYHYRQHPHSLTLSGIADKSYAYVHENIKIAEKFLTRSSMPPAFQKKCQHWHAHETAELFIAYIKKGRFYSAWQAGWRGWTYSFLWPLRFVKRLCLRIKIDKTLNI